MNNSYLNLVVFVIAIVAFCVAAYFYIRETNRKFKEHFSPTGIASMTIDEKDYNTQYDLENLEVESHSIDEIITGCDENGADSCSNNLFCEYSDQTCKDVSDLFEFKIIKQNLSELLDKIVRNRLVIRLPKLGKPVFQNENGEKFITVDIHNRNSFSLNDILITYTNENEETEEITVEIVSDILDNKYKQNPEDNYYLIVKCLISNGEKDPEDPKKSSSSASTNPTSSSVSDCNDEFMIFEYGNFTKCALNENCRIDTNFENEQNQFKCSVNTADPKTTTILHINLPSKEDPSPSPTMISNLELNDLDKRFVQTISDLSTLNLITDEGGETSPISLYELINRNFENIRYGKTNIMLNHVTSMDTINFKRIIENIRVEVKKEENSPIKYLHITNENTEPIDFYLIGYEQFIPLPNNFEGEPSKKILNNDFEFVTPVPATSFPACQEKNIPYQCINKLCMDQDLGEFVYNPETGEDVFLNQYSQCDLEVACTEENVERLCPSEFTPGANNYPDVGGPPTPSVSMMNGPPTPSVSMMNGPPTPSVSMMNGPPTPSVSNNEADGVSGVDPTPDGAAPV